MKAHEYDFSYQLNESFEDAIEGLKNIKKFWNESLNGTIKNIGGVFITAEVKALKAEFTLDYETVAEEWWSWDSVIRNFINENQGHDYELDALQGLKANLLMQIEKLDNQIEKVQND